MIKNIKQAGKFNGDLVIESSQEYLLAWRPEVPHLSPRSPASGPHTPRLENNPNWPDRPGGTVAAAHACPRAPPDSCAPA